MAAVPRRVIVAAGGVMATIVVVGDVGGFPDLLAAAVSDAVEDAGTVVIQVGDLVDRGPDSSGALDFVADRLEIAPDRWIQLVGNHESQYLGGERFWPQPLSDADAARLRTWWLRERLRVAAAVRTCDGEELLITHAGLTRAAWERLGSPVTAATAADLLNTRPEPLLWDDTGPLWAEAGSDLYPSWMRDTRPMPFGQIHGHSAIVDYHRGEWVCDGRIRQRSTVDWAARHTVTRAGGGRFIAIDPKHGRTGAPRWLPLILHDAVLLA
jgi:hypothetical protein